VGDLLVEREGDGEPNTELLSVVVLVSEGDSVGELFIE